MSELAQRRVRDFQQRCGETALHLAYHAALPVALNADLLHFLWINFFLDPPEPLPYTVEFEFLLSPLCREIDEGLYEIEPEIRDILLTRLAQEYDDERIRDIATLLWQYIDRFSPWSDLAELERAQQLTALNFLSPEKAQQWLSDIETYIRQGNATEREWFIAMQQEIAHQSSRGYQTAGEEQASSTDIDPPITKDIDFPGIFDICPNLSASNFQVTGPPSSDFNSLAWAVSDEEVNRCWDPAPGYYWLPNVPRERSLDAYIQLFHALGYIDADNPEYETGFEKIAIYADNTETPTHVARQLSNRKWTSKIYDLEDIEHESLDAIAGGELGNPVYFMKRQW